MIPAPFPYEPSVFIKTKRAVNNYGWYLNKAFNEYLASLNSYREAGIERDPLAA